MHHEMTRHAEPFSALRYGTKHIESRLFDEKRRHIQLGDLIIFKNVADTEETVTTKVIGLLRYQTFSLLFADFKPSIFGGTSLKQLEDQIYSFYSREDEATYGVLGIRIESLQ